MHHRVPLPAALGEAFHVRDAAAHGIGRGRCAARDLARPFPGVRSLIAPASFTDVTRSYAPRLGEGRAYSKRTSARLLGLPLPWRWHPSEPLDVAVADHSAPPTVAGVRGHRIHSARMQVTHAQGMPVLDALTTTLLLAPQLSRDELLVILEAVATPSEWYPGLVGDRPLADITVIAERLREWGFFPGVQKVRDALARLRTGVESPKETETRLAIVAAGMPEPEVQWNVRDRDRKIAKVDLAYPKLKIAIEYEGDGHRTDPAQWREDIRRQRELEERGWLVLRITQLDLTSGRAAFLARLRRAIAIRSAR